MGLAVKVNIPDPKSDRERIIKILKRVERFWSNPSPETKAKYRFDSGKFGYMADAIIDSGFSKKRKGEV